MTTKHHSPEGEELRSYTVRQPSHPLLPKMIPSEVEPHIEALENASIYNDLTQEMQATIITLMQQAYRNGQVHQHAERIDSDAVWVDDIGMIERQPNDTWIVTGYDAAKDAAMIRARDSELGIGYSAEQYNKWAKSYAARQLGSLGGSANTDLQNKARAKNSKNAGRKKGSKNKPKDNGEA